MQTMPLDQAEGRLIEIVARLRPDQEVVLTRDDKPIETIRAAPMSPREPPRFGTLRGSILYIAPNFDAISEGFESKKRAEQKQSLFRSSLWVPAPACARYIHQELAASPSGSGMNSTASYISASGNSTPISLSGSTASSPW